MPYYIGTDEAGYGPNLGPLVVSATVWHAAELLDGQSLYERLAPTIVFKPRETTVDRVAIADSKVLYGSNKNPRHLERGLLGVLNVLGRQTNHWRDAWTALDGYSCDTRQTLPWYADYQCELPLAVDAAEIDRLADCLNRAFEQACIRPVDLRSRAVFPAEFNELCERYHSKGLALSHITLGLLADVIRPLGDEPIYVLCDKHGGRNRYADLLAEHFPDWLVEIHGESRDRSVYRLGPTGRRIEVAFAVGGEAYLPAALASMASKYLRELAMKAFNAFWTNQIDGLRATAGYPVDAKRFKGEITECQQALGIEDHCLWRIK